MTKVEERDSSASRERVLNLQSLCLPRTFLDPEETMLLQQPALHFFLWRWLAILTYSHRYQC